MNTLDSSSGGQGALPPRTYNLVLLESTKNVRVRNIIQESAFVDRQQAEEWLKHPPVVILENRPLQEVVDLRTRLMRYGVNAQIEKYVADVAEIDSQYEIEETILPPPDQPEIIIDATDQPEEPLPIPSPVVVSSSSKKWIFIGSRFWSCLVSAVFVVLILSAFTLWMLHSVKRTHPVTGLEQAPGQPQIATSAKSSLQESLQRQRNKSPVSNEDINLAFKNNDAAKAARILDQYDRLQQVKSLASALNGEIQPQPQPEAELSQQPTEQPTTSDNLSPDQIASSEESDIDPAVISALRDMKNRRSLEKEPEINWEITGNSITGRVNLPDYTAMKVGIHAPGRIFREFHKQVLDGKINIPPFTEIPAGTIQIRAQIESFNNQPPTIQRFLSSESKLFLQDVTVQADLDLYEAISPLYYYPISHALVHIETNIRKEGYMASASAFPAGAAVADSVILIRGNSDDPYPFIKSSILAAGLITRNINDPPLWIVIEVNGVRYGIESYLCREAIRNFPEQDPAVDDYILNRIITL